jgi:hypothetical protein
LNALQQLRAAGLSADAELCPHPERLAHNSITVQGGRRPMVVCPGCKAMFEGLIAGWHNRQLSPGQVVATMRQNGYTRGDGARFVLQLVASSLRVRLGFAR